MPDRVASGVARQKFRVAMGHLMHMFKLGAWQYYLSALSLCKKLYKISPTPFGVATGVASPSFGMARPPLGYATVPNPVHKMPCREWGQTLASTHTNLDSTDTPKRDPMVSCRNCYTARSQILHCRCLRRSLDKSHCKQLPSRSSSNSSHMTDLTYNNCRCCK